MKLYSSGMRALELALGFMAPVCASAADLYVASEGNSSFDGGVYKIPPTVIPTTFASGLHSPLASPLTMTGMSLLVISTQISMSSHRQGAVRFLLVVCFRSVWLSSIMEICLRQMQMVLFTSLRPPEVDRPLLRA